jgi:hypothetical protein
MKSATARRRADCSCANLSSYPAELGSPASSAIAHLLCLGRSQVTRVCRLETHAECVWKTAGQFA